MDKSCTTTQGIAVTPHHLATQSAIAILREGGTAIEATVAAAATLSVVYPHMTGIGGDGFWLIVPPHEEPFVIEACGAAGSLATRAYYQGYDEIPYRGPKSISTIPGAVGGWQKALDYVSKCGYQKIPLARLLSDAIEYAEGGFPVSTSHAQSLNEISSDPNVTNEFKKIHFPNGRIPKIGEKFYQKKLGKTFKSLADYGLNSFYTGEVSKNLIKDLETLGVPLTKRDLNSYLAIDKMPLRLLHSKGEIFNAPPPSQGSISLLILGILDYLEINGEQEGDFVHSIIEATKQAFTIRDKYITDPAEMTLDVQSLTNNKTIRTLANNINRDHASFGNSRGDADTVWVGVMDKKGFSVSYIQSLYFPFGSGVISPSTGIVMHNRGVVFTLHDGILKIRPGKKPFHTLNPAFARLNDGRLIVYGTRGADGQPQTQAAIFHRYVVQNLNLQTSITAPRWIYGRTYGKHHKNVCIENRFGDETLKYLLDRGHNITMLPSFSESCGNAGALVRHSDGVLEGAYDPRSDGSVAGF